MKPEDLVISTLEGDLPPRVPTFLAGIEDRTFKEAFGRKQVPGTKIRFKGVFDWVLDHVPARISRPALQGIITRMMAKRIEAGAMLGFDMTWGLYDETFIPVDANRMIRYSGSVYRIVNDGFGNLSYFYEGPGIRSKEALENWEHWPDADKLARNTRDFYTRMVSRHGKKTCIAGQGPVYGLFESLLWAIGFANLASWMRKDPGSIRGYVARLEEICSACYDAMLDAGIKVILQTDDCGFKNGPLIDPEKLDAFFGPSYTRLIKQVHDRGGKFVLHSCGNNTVNFPRFIKWGVDGAHALENTAGLDYEVLKGEFGDKLTLIGGVGIDHALSDRSTDAEVEDEVRRVIQMMAPGGRFIIGNVHSEASVPASKLRVMLDAVGKHGTYPITFA